MARRIAVVKIYWPDDIWEADTERDYLARALRDAANNVERVHDFKPLPLGWFNSLGRIFARLSWTTEDE